MLGALLWAFSACDVSEPAETHRFIRLRMPDSVRIGDWVEVLMRLPGGSGQFDTLWNAPLISDTSLAKLPAPRYKGGDAELLVSAWDGGRLVYRTRVELHPGNAAPSVTNVLPPDSLAPWLRWEGPDSLDLETMPADPSLAAIFPNMGCVDDRDRDTSRPSAVYLEDPARVGLGRIRYECRDRAGNAAPVRYRRLRILSEVDTVAPAIVLSLPDSLVVRTGHADPLGTASCVDAKDPRPRMRDSGSVVETAPGTYPLVYECEDASGNSSRRVRMVYVVPAPDSVKPRLTLRGPDSVVVYDGEAYADSGADCMDDRDGALPMDVRDPVDTRKRREYEVLYACADSAGNAASAVRKVRVVRRPDPEGPIIILRGPDTAVAYDREAYKDSGAVCLDSRDGMLEAVTQGTIDTGIRGVQSLTFTCADSAGNEARIDRIVRVIRRPDTVKPALTLLGPDSMQVWQGSGYADSGAVCADDRDGTPAVQLAGNVNTAVRGLKTLSFRCADSAGNEALRIRKVLVVRVPDTLKPVLSLRGPDSLQVPQGSAYYDSGAACADDRDGSLPVLAGGSVNTFERGPNVLTYHCSDSAGNASDRIRKVVVIRAPDTLRPALSLRGKDSLQAWEGFPYADSGASCLDDRDGNLPVQVTGSVNTSARGQQTLSFRCSDSAGNEAARVRKVVVIRAPDSVKPVLALRGPPAVNVPQGSPYSDSGAVCSDARDGTLPALTHGSVNTAEAGTYLLSYVCADSAGNAADSATRSVWVFRPDTLPPVISLAGTDTLVVVSQAGFSDPGGACRDAEDGALPLVLQGIATPVTGPGWYQASYACTDHSGNTAVKTRALKIGLFGTYLPAMADGQIDTTNEWANVGSSSALSLATEPGGGYFDIIRFNLSGVGKAGLKSAKLHLFTFLHDRPWPGGFVNLTFRVYRVKSDWVEGTGDWFFYDGNYQNGGAGWYRYYPLSDSMKSAVTNPGEPSGITGMDRALVRDTALVPVATRTDSIYFGPWDPYQIPAPDRLSPVELDVTDYVKTADPTQDYGFVIKVSGLPDRTLIGFTTREAGGGHWAPRLMLEY